MPNYRSELESYARVASNTAGRKFFIDYAIAKPRLHMRTQMGGEISVSPRLPNPDMKRWLQGFIEGMQWMQSFAEDSVRDALQT